VEPFLPLLFDAGVDCLQGLESKAGMDQPALFRKLGDRVVWFGNIDIRVLESNDRGRIDQEIEAKLWPVTRQGGRCILHSDHSISPLVEYETYRYFLERGTAL
jgi:uroporphyrinogen decarboxylase